ncbi:MAG: HEPN domain-containing protein [Endomicrobium sp.]|jgi:HEPN domain-containing protein|nr:HEPN domain-containing protein [Endomicrobium sp.]
MKRKELMSLMRVADTEVRESKLMLSHCPTPFELICFHSHQAVEKYLKAFLIFNDIKFSEQSHILPALNELCEKVDCKFENLIPVCWKLAQYANIIKYPRDNDLDMRAATEAVEHAIEVKWFVPIIHLRSAIGYNELDSVWVCNKFG